MKYTNPELRAMLVDEYVLGTLHGGARRRFEQLMADDPELFDQVNQAGLRYDNLAKLLPPTQPSNAVWSNISRRIDSITNESTANTAADIKDIHSGAQSTESTSASLGERVAEELRSALLIWRSLAIVSTVCAAALAFYLSLMPHTAVTTIVVITDDLESKANWVLALKEDESQLIIRPLIEQKPLPDRDFQLWVKATQTSKVQSVGTISGASKTVLDISKEQAQRIQDAVLFGVSIEPKGGSPTGQPTTEPLFHGKRVDL